MSKVRIGWWKRLFGTHGERLAARHLKMHGLQILARQVRNRYGEIDLIARDGHTIVFVEVKTRTSVAKGTPKEAVTASKQRQITRAAIAWLKQRRLFGSRSRFDVISIVHPPGTSPQIEHIRNAFEATDLS